MEDVLVDAPGGIRKITRPASWSGADSDISILEYTDRALIVKLEIAPQITPAP
jgi:hypothetical protein